MENSITPNNNSSTLTPPEPPSPRPPEPIPVTPASPASAPETSKSPVSPTPSPSEPLPPSATPTPVAIPEPPVPTVKKPGHPWIRPLRLLLWLVTIVGLCIGLALKSRSSTSAALANGTESALSLWGNLIFWPSLILGLGNFALGVTRWILRWRHESWKIGRVVGKLIGGGIWRFFAIATIVLLTLFLIAPAVSNQIVANTLSSRNQVNLSSPHPRLDALEYAAEHVDELSVEELEAALEAADPLRNVEFNTDASGNLAASSPSLFSTPVSAAASRDVTTLNKARLTPSGNFVVFYTDTGHNAVSEETVSNLLVMLDNIVANYEKNLGLEYQYAQLTNLNDIPILTTDIFQSIVNVGRKISQQAVLVANGLPASTTDSAMPVYLLDETAGESETNTFASYAGLEWLLATNTLLLKLGNLFGEETAKVYHSSPSFPFILLNPKKIGGDDFEIVTAHELGHHYISSATFRTCFQNSLGTCPLDDFVDETIPNYFAINVVDKQSLNSVLAGHNKNYLDYGFCRPINLAISSNDIANGYCTNPNGQFLGYPAVAFLQTYSELVPNSLPILFNAIINGNALQVLYDAAGPETFTSVMQKLTERNLTKDFAQNSLRSETIPMGRDIPCNDLCSRNYTIQPAASEYFYFNTSEYDGTTVKPIFNAPGLSVTVLGRKDGAWSPLEVYSGSSTKEYKIKKDSGYDAIALAFANGSISESARYNLSITAEPLEELVPEEPVETNNDYNFPVRYISSDCMEINFDDFLSFGADILKTFSPDSLTNDTFAPITDVTNMGVRSASLCRTNLNSRYSFDEARIIVKNFLGAPIELMTTNQPLFHLTAFVGINALDPTNSKFFFLMQNDNGPVQLIHLRFNSTAP